MSAVFESCGNFSSGWNGKFCVCVWHIHVCNMSCVYDLPNSNKINGFWNCSTYFFHGGSSSDAFNSLWPIIFARYFASDHVRPVRVSTRSRAATSLAAKIDESAVDGNISSSILSLDTCKRTEQVQLINRFVMQSELFSFSFSIFGKFRSIYRYTCVSSSQFDRIVLPIVGINEWLQQIFHALESRMRFFASIYHINRNYVYYVCFDHFEIFYVNDLLKL